MVLVKSTSQPTETVLNRGRLQCFSAMLVLFGGRGAGCFREVAA